MMAAVGGSPAAILGCSSRPLLGAGTPTAPSIPPLRPATHETYRALAAEVDQNLQTQVIAKWFPGAVDRQEGGFYQYFTEDWTRLPPTDKAIVYQSRMTWIAAQTALRNPTQRAEFLGYARNGLNFLANRMWDPQDGGLFWSIRDGQPERGGEKHAYGISFAIYAAAGAYRATKDAAALDLGRKTYAWLDAHAHDAVNGGYYEALSRNGTPITDATPGNDFIGTRYGEKSMNTHIHLLESLTALYDVWPDPALKSRLDEMFTVVCEKIATPDGRLTMFFTPDWKAASDQDSYGHNVETAYLLGEAAEALGKANDPAQEALSRRLVDHALQYGWDQDHGGFYDSGPANGPASHTDKVWWVQAEGLNALLRMHALYGHQTPRYWQAFQQQWQFIQTFQVDHHYGGWYGTVAPDGTAPTGRLKSDAWTDPYHQGRAEENVVDLLRRLAARA
jgi:mannobiose 2-epimerase